jgi:hypothetical protein
MSLAGPMPKVDSTIDSRLLTAIAHQLEPPAVHCWGMTQEEPQAASVALDREAVLSCGGTGGSTGMLMWHHHAAVAAVAGRSPTS